MQARASDRASARSACGNGRTNSDRSAGPDKATRARRGSPHANPKAFGSKCRCASCCSMNAAEIGGNAEATRIEVRHSEQPRATHTISWRRGRADSNRGGRRASDRASARSACGNGKTTGIRMERPRTSGWTIEEEAVKWKRKDDWDRSAGTRLPRRRVGLVVETER